MKTRESIQKQLFKISEDEVISMESLITDLESIKDKKQVNEETITKMTNILTVLGSMKDNYMWRLLRAAKQNHMID